MPSDRVSWSIAAICATAGPTRSKAWATRAPNRDRARRRQTEHQRARRRCDVAGKLGNPVKRGMGSSPTGRLRRGRAAPILLPIFAVEGTDMSNQTHDALIQLSDALAARTAAAAGLVVSI